MIALKNILKRKFETLAYFYSYLKGRVFITIALNIVVGLLDGLGLSMFLPLLQIAGGQTAVNSSNMGRLGFLIDWLQASGFSVNLRISVMVIVVFFILKGLAYYFKGVYQVKIQQYFIREIRLGNIRNLGDLGYEYFVRSDAGRIQNTLTGEVERVSKACQSYFLSFQNGVLVGVYILFAFSVNWQFAVMVSCGGILSDLVYRKIYKSTKGVSGKLTVDITAFQRLIIQAVANYKYLKATGEIKKYQQMLEEQVNVIEENNSKIGILSVILSASREPLSIIVVSAVILVQTSLFNAQLAGILVSLLFFYRALSSLMQFQTSWNAFLGTAGALKHMQDFSRELISFKERSGGLQADGFKQVIMLKDVNLDYAGKAVLKDISIKIRKNETIAFVGESGSGKTTLVNLICGLVKIRSGMLKIDGQNLDELDLGTYRKRIGYITQDVVIFNDTIYNNITLWEDKSPENIARFQQACINARIWDFVLSVPAGYDTELGNNGINLSGGQKQRISVARELYKNIDILIMDEATSALDAEMEAQLQKNIEALSGKLTLIIIAHRLSTIKNADRIMFLKQGSILQTGSFETLMAGNEEFRNMVELQRITSNKKEVQMVTGNYLSIND